MAQRVTPLQDVEMAAMMIKQGNNLAAIKLLRNAILALEGR